MSAKVSGILFLSFHQACANLEFYLDDNTLDLLADLSPEGWYPLKQYNELLATVSSRYTDPASILERVGEAMIHGWYHFGPGKEVISSGVDFLHRQTGSAGYQSLIRGPAEVVGEFRLESLDESLCQALVVSTTPFSKNLERGILQSGLALAGDLRLISVDNSTCENEFHIDYIPAGALDIDEEVVAEVDRFLASVTSTGPAALSQAAQRELGYRYRELATQQARQVSYWQATNQTLSDALVRNQRQQEELSQSNEEFEAANQRADILKNAIIDQAFNGIVTFDQYRDIIEFNTSAESIFNCRRNEVIGIKKADALLPRELFTLPDRPHPEKPLRVQIDQSDGISVPVDILSRRVVLDGQTLTTAYVRDMTAIVTAEQEIERQREALNQSEKLTALGSLLSGVAHELNNPLSIVAGRAQMLEQDNDYPELNRSLKKIRQAADRCTRIVKTFLAMARRQEPERTSVDINQLIHENTELLDYTLRTSGISVSLDLESNLPALQADASQLNQVITNLLINAQQALAAVAGERKIAVSTGLSESSREVIIEVKDNGPGVPQDVRHRIFEPFYTTKHGTGTGVGLSLSHGLVCAHGGCLELLGDRQCGAAFRITLPVISVAEKTAKPTEVDTPAATTARVLIVDDEEDFAEMVEDMLQSRGHQTTLATGGWSALDLLQQQSFDVILSDLNMPELNGQEFYACLQRDFPDYISKIAFVTGDTLGSSAQEFLADGDKRYIEKPFTPNDIRKLVVEIIVS